MIVLEGPDGCGKGTMLAAIKERLKEKKIEAVYPVDPGGTEIGRQIRAILLDPANKKMSRMTELLLYVASRAQLVEEVIRPALAADKLVICDRFFVSTLVYQGAEDWIPERKLEEITLLGLDLINPDHMILLDVPAEIGLHRVGKDMDRMEQKGLSFHRAVSQRYLNWAQNLRKATPGRITIVDATQPVEDVRTQVLSIVDELVGI
jgi:dTMP kinase